MAICSYCILGAVISLENVGQFYCKYLRGWVAVETLKSYLYEFPCSSHSRCMISNANIGGVKAPSLVTVSIPNILYVLSVNH